MLTINAPEFHRFAAAARASDRTILTSLRKRLKVIAAVGVEAVQKKVTEPARSSGDDSVGSRAEIAASTRAVVSFAKRAGGVKITTNNSKVDPAHKGIVAAYNRDKFRHPVYGNRSVFADQPGRPYFDAAIVPVMDKRMPKEMAKVIDDAVRALGGRGK